MSLKDAAMSIIKIQINIAELKKVANDFAVNRMQALSNMTNDLKSVLSRTVNELLQAEIEIFLGSEDQKDNKKNGYHPVREYAFKGIGKVRIKVPKDRNGKFQSNVILEHERVDPRIKADIAILHLAGLSTRSLAMLSKRLLGVKINKDSVTESLSLVKDEAIKWLERPLNERYWAIFVDGTNFKIQRRDGVEKEPSLVVLGISENNYKSILAIEPGSRDNVSAWRSVFQELKKRGLDASYVKVGIMDGLPGLEDLFKEEFSNSVTARCWRHALQNIMNKVPKRFEAAFKQMVDSVMYASSEIGAREAFNSLKKVMDKDASKAVRCLEKDLDSLLIYYTFEKKYWVTLRTTNSIERVNKELKRRYRSMGTIGEGSLVSLLAFTALKLEMGWQSYPVDSQAFHNLKSAKSNSIEKVVAQLKLVE